MSITQSHTSGPSRLEVCTPSNTTVFDCVRALWVGGAGNIAVSCEEDKDVDGAYTVSRVMVGVPGGIFLPGRFRKVWATGTTATSLLLVY